MEIYEVGGCVRDEILGVQSKDIDYSVVLNDGDMVSRRTRAGQPYVPEPFDVMVELLEAKGFRIFLKTREHLTVRAQFPRYNGHPAVIKHGQPGMTADFVLARKEGVYSDGRRPDTVEPGTLHDDLARRDFTMNAIAKFTDKFGDTGYVDPFNGREDISKRLIRAVGNPMDRLTEDALRAVRAVRFAVTKGFMIEPTLVEALRSRQIADLVDTKISDERIAVELSKMFRYDTFASMQMLSNFPMLTHAIFSGRVSLDATLKTKGRGK